MLAFKLLEAFCEKRARRLATFDMVDDAEQPRGINVQIVAAMASNGALQGKAPRRSKPA